MKRIWILLVLAVLAMSLFVASCNSGDDSGSGGKGKTAMKKGAGGDSDNVGDATSDN
jgi:predicted small secreted protein